MNFKNVIPFAALLVCSLGNPAQVEARTPQQVTGTCVVEQGFDLKQYRCTVTPDGGGGYIVDTHGGMHENYYVNASAGEFYYGGKKCGDPTIIPTARQQAICVEGGSTWAVYFPTR